MIADAHIAQPKRRPTRPSKAARAKRVEKKVQRGAIKRARGRVELD
jgi:ribosome-associated protein